MGEVLDVFYDQEADEDEYGDFESLEVLTKGVSLTTTVLDRLEKFPSIRRRIKRKLKSGDVRVVWDDMESLRGSYNSRTGIVTINRRYRRRRVSIAILLHELIHAIGGTELDAEFFENECCSYADGARLPTYSNLHVDDFDKFERDESALGLNIVVRRRRYVVTYGKSTRTFTKPKN